MSDRRILTDDELAETTSRLEREASGRIRFGWTEKQPERMMMKGTGPRNERETSVVFDEAGETARVWTASTVTYNKLKRQGFTPIEENERSATFVVPKTCVSFRKVKRPTVLTEAQRLSRKKQGQALAERRRKAVASPAAA